MLGVGPGALHDVVPETIRGIITETLAIDPDLSDSHVKVLVLLIQIGLECTIVGENWGNHEDAISPQLHFVDTVGDGSICVPWYGMFDEIELLVECGVIAGIAWVSSICEEDGDAIAHRVTGCTVCHERFGIWLVVHDAVGTC